jgi:predicted RecA/RadA family phage recombinase
MRNYIHRGDTITCPAAPYDLASGDGALAGALFGVAATDALTGAEVELLTIGVVALPKATGAAGFGDPLFWDDMARQVATTGTVRIGVAVVPAASDDATVAVRLNGSF